jgi:RNA polymerase sigma factor (sigma-70 family)
MTAEEPDRAQPATVHVVDDDSAVRRSLAVALKIRGLLPRCYAGAHEFLERYTEAKPECLVLDVRMPGMSGLELQSVLRDRGIDIPIVFVTGHGEVPMAVRAMKAGAADFVEKPFSMDTLLEGIARSVDADAQSLQNRRRRAEANALLATLTPREREVMDLLVDGKLNKMIAVELGISVRTVEVHRSRIMQKLHARSLSDIVRLALSA